jgi:NADP-dependent 3-hydroxy acid dehydrogenase YdfG
LKADDFFKNKVIIVTGASSGIGRELALRLAKHQANVVLAARRSDKLAELETHIVNAGGQAISIQTDVADEADVMNLVNTTLSTWHRIDIFISNAGQYIQSPIVDSDKSDFEKSFDVNFYGSYYAVKAALPHMIMQNSGYFVFINSLDAKKGIVGDAPYVTAKYALDGFAEVLRQEVMSNGIAVSTVYPGRVDTPMIQDLQVPWISPKISVEKAANAIVKGIKKKKPIIVVPKLFFPLGALNNISPRLTDWFYSTFQLEGRKIV